MSYKWRLSVKYNPDQPREPAGGPDGGRWTSAGLGRGKIDVAAVLDKETADWISESSVLGSGIGTDSYVSLMKSRGVSDEEITLADKFIDAHGFGTGMQEPADREIAEHVASGDRMGQVFMIMSDVNEAIYEHWKQGLPKRLAKEEERLRSDWEFDMKFPGGKYPRWEGDTLESAIDELREDFDLEGSIFLYRLGKHGNKPIESWTTNEEGFEWDIREGGFTGIGWDISRTLDDLHAEGYRVLAGFANPSGAPGEGEVTMIKAPDWYKTP